MSIFDRLRPKGKSDPPQAPAETPDEEFLLPKLSRGDFPLTEEVFRRWREEQIREKYGLPVEKEGHYV